MELDRLLPLLIIWIIWSIINRKRRLKKEKPKLSPVDLKGDVEKLEPVVLDTPFLMQPEVEKGVQPGEKQTEVQSASIPARPGVVRKYPDRKFLRQAVIWSEILAPPVSLRDDG